MSVRQGNKVIAGHINYHPDLFDHKWADHQLNDISWLRADTFSWQSGAVYTAAYQHLADDVDGKTLQSETIGSTTIQFYLADDGHKICPASEESNVAAIYTATGVAWYYIIDTTNQRFKLPRTKRDFSGLVNGVGSGTQGSTKIIPDFTHIVSVYSGYVATTDGWVVAFGVNGTGSIYVNGVSVAQGNYYSGKWSGNTNCQIMVKRGDVITLSYSGSAPTIYFAPNITGTEIVSTQQYLYFYIGNFTQTALENTAGLNTELFNGKVDTGHQVIAFQAPTAQNNYTWYRLYADGWVEQGGTVGKQAASGTISINIPVEMANTYYTLTSSAIVNTNGSTDHRESANEYISKSTTSFEKYMWTNWGSFWWKIEGMAA